mgnify:CR=1 FL=1
MKTKANFSTLFFTLLLVIGIHFTSKAQELRLGVHGALPVGDAADVSSFNAGVEASLYFIKINDNLDIGASTGYTRFFGKDDTVNGIDVSYDDFAYIPISASARGHYDNGFLYVADVGYGVGLNDVDGGLLYQAKLGWTFSNIDTFLFYRGITADEIDNTSLGLGLTFKVL